ncbi:MAG: ribosome maturation factor RimP [Campylobacteraceae bacterium]|nr:ribosome maturation factor RimP [Campylobacteraceae bacterium]
MTNLDALVKECGVSLYDTEIANENGRTIYRVYIIKSGGVSLDDCERVSKLLSPIFDVEPPIAGQYMLEVSSPGLERKLTKPEHFINSIGEKAKVTTVANDKFQGEIVGFVGDTLTIKDTDTLFEIKFSDIKKARTYIEW